MIAPIQIFSTSNIYYREPDMIMIELNREDPQEPLGFTVTGYRTADSR